MPNSESEQAGNTPVPGRGIGHHAKRAGAAVNWPAAILAVAGLGTSVFQYVTNKEGAHESVGARQELVVEQLQKKVEQLETTFRDREIKFVEAIAKINGYLAARAAARDRSRVFAELPTPETASLPEPAPMLAPTTADVERKAAELYASP